MNNHGLFISLEGPDGSGKTTQITLLAKKLREAGYDVVETREPGGTLISNKIREVVLDNANAAMTARTEALLYAAQRAQHVEEKIIPALKQGKIVLTDRYADSTYVYQGLARKLGIGDIRAITAFATGGLKPDMTLLLDVSAECGSQRMVSRGEKDRLEMVNSDFTQNVRQGYLSLAAAEPERFRVVNAERPVSEIADELSQIVMKYIMGRKNAV